MHKLRALKCMLSVVSSDHQSLQYLSDINTDDDEEHLEFDLEKHLQVFSGLRSQPSSDIMTKLSRDQFFMRLPFVPSEEVLSYGSRLV